MTNEEKLKNGTNPSEKPSNSIILVQRVGHEENSEDNIYLQTSSVTKFGRVKDNNHVCLRHGDISRNHSNIFVKNETTFVYTDTNTTNGSEILKYYERVNNDGTRTGYYQKFKVMNSSIELNLKDIFVLATDVLQDHGFKYKIYGATENITEKTRGKIVEPKKYPSEATKRKRSETTVTIKPLSKNVKQNSDQRMSNEDIDSLKCDIKQLTMELVNLKNAQIQKINPKDETKVKETEALKNMLTSLTDECNCSICSEILIPPCVTTNCGHNFCEFCIDRWSWQKENPVCPTCNEKITYKSRNVTLKNIIESYEKTLSKEEKEDRLQAIEEQKNNLNLWKEMIEKQKKEEMEKNEENKKIEENLEKENLYNAENVVDENLLRVLDEERGAKRVTRASSRRKKTPLLRDGLSENLNNSEGKIVYNKNRRKQSSRVRRSVPPESNLVNM